MPELPEVDALAAFLRDTALGRVVERVEPVAVSALKTFDPPPSALRGATLAAVERHGKFLDLVFATPDGERIDLVTHLARAGWLRWRETQPSAPARPGRGPLALRVVFDDRGGFDLTEAGTQKRLAVYLVREPAEVPGIARLGVDPFAPEFTVAALAEILTAAGRGQLKGVLTDQSRIAGVGNAYSDEALWAAHLSPFRPAGGLGPAEVATLHEGLVGVLTEARDTARGLGAGELKAEKKANLSVHGRTGLPCPRCGDTIREVSFADRSLQYCPTCQTGGRPLADRRLSRLLK
ncbi:Formamidopyrimidine-DNA glycosylase [Frankia canadensis]|uniref:Formamidopyrimidine-DNA glycosylase n=1 Tax=Frankia canadensis TaxID=1836972 RepID=A0A2I2L0M9_9ACTN|nr:DNA-formamidopyrimidine glycosylase family protein [Frankia canadensis]SNQ51468.1 Formamidopyrimidine-DNA glycosylase [Frankia canadensis]SOU58758.1 Formamidopyrimidine-DNA glycosylase [Frankia canadensis]